MALLADEANERRLPVLALFGLNTVSDSSLLCARERTFGRCMHHRGDPDLGGGIAAQMHEVCGGAYRRQLLARHGFIRA